MQLGNLSLHQKNKKNELFSEKNITTKRPGNGISPMKWDNILGKGKKII